jgi:2-polyprenyl-3-methyl-5-hydroxy-6-metoxy-1,4-benzoquinol methylase
MTQNLTLCPICRHAQINQKYSTDQWQIRQCLFCKTGITDPVPDMAENSDQYEENYFTGQSGMNFFDETITKNDALRFKQVLNIIDSFHNKKGRILDIGCATGNFLTVAKHSGWEIFGFEKSRFAAQYTAKKLSAVVGEGNFCQNTYPDLFFDAITMNHTLEHLANPAETLNQAYRILKPGGILYIEVPNFNSWQGQSQKSNWEDLRPEQHLYHYTPQSLQYLLANAQFQRTRLMSRVNIPWNFRELLAYFSNQAMPNEKPPASAESSLSQIAPQHNKNSSVKKTINHLIYLFFLPLIVCEQRMLGSRRLIALAQK